MASNPLGTTDITVDRFKDTVRQVARQNLFYIFLPANPAQGVSIDTKNAAFLVRSSTLPGHSVENQDLNWQGYTVHIGGTTTATDDWTVTFTAAADMKLYDALYKWTEAVHNQETNVHGDPQTYMDDINIQLLHPTTFEPVREIKLIGAYCRAVGDITLDYSDPSIASFDGTFSFQRHEVVE